MSDNFLTPFIITIDMKEVCSSDVAGIKTFSILIEPAIQKTISEVINKIKQLFDLDNDINIAHTQSSIIPERETSKILYYLKSVRITSELFTSMKQPASTSSDEKHTNRNDGINHNNINGLENGVAEESPHHHTIILNNECEDTTVVKKKRKYIKSFSVGDFLTDLRSTENCSQQTAVNGELESSTISIDGEDGQKKRKRTRRRKKKDISYEEESQEASSPKYIKPYSFELAGHEESKHLRFDEGGISEETTVNAKGGEYNDDSLVTESNEASRADLSALFSLKSDVGSPVIFMRTSSAVETAEKQ